MLTGQQSLLRYLANKMFSWLSKKKGVSLRDSIEKELLNQAAFHIKEGSRFQFRVEEIGGESEIRRFIVSLSGIVGENVRANCGHGLMTVYGDGEDDGGTSVVVATIKNHRPS